MKSLLLLLVLSSPLYAKTPPKLRDIGIIGLMSHDLFSWDRNKEINTENGRLDLSTIFDYEDGTRWQEGGNPKNAENAPVYTITLGLVSYYKTQLKFMNHTEARKSTVIHFQKMVKESFERLSGLSWPTEGRDEMVTNTEQAALRAMHDILPGRAKLFDGLRKSFDVTNFLNAKIKLSEKELDQELKNFDGDYDPEYKSINIPFSKKVVNLKEIDRKFIEKFSPYKHSEMLEELARFGSGEITSSEVSFMHHFYELVSKGICYKGNIYMPDHLDCY
jgi:hypothetical protein